VAGPGRYGIGAERSSYNCDKIRMHMKIQIIKTFETRICLHFLVIYGINSQDIHKFLTS
jgi:hypothetical protein